MKIKRAVMDVIITITVIIAIICIFTSANELREEYRVKKSYKTLSDEVCSTDGKGEDFIAFEVLKKINPDIIAWIRIPNTPVDYPIVMAKDDNDYYLSHNIRGTYSQYGSIFTDFRLYGNPFKEKNCIIYGHNMGRWTNVMFSSLMNYEKQNYYEKHKKIYVYTEENGKTEYRIISVRQVSDSTYAYSLTFQSEKAFKEWLKKSIYDSKIECDVDGVYGTDKVITLSTCTYGENKLVLVCGQNG